MNPFEKVTERVEELAKFFLDWAKIHGYLENELGLPMAIAWIISLAAVAIPIIGIPILTKKIIDLIRDK